MSQGFGLVLLTFEDRHFREFEMKLVDSSAKLLRLLRRGLFLGGRVRRSRMAGRRSAVLWRGLGHGTVSSGPRFRPHGRPSHRAASWGGITTSIVREAPRTSGPAPSTAKCRRRTAARCRAIRIVSAWSPTMLPPRARPLRADPGRRPMALAARAGRRSAQTTAALDASARRSPPYCTQCCHDLIVAAITKPEV